MAGGFGAMPLGSGPFGTGSPLALEILQCIVVSANEVWVVVNELSGKSAFFSSSELNPKNWTLTPLSVGAFPRLIPFIESVETVDEAIAANSVALFNAGLIPALRVFTDGPLSPNEPYNLAFAGFTVVNCDVVGLMVGEDARELDAAQDKGTIEDYKNPQFQRDKLPLGALGTYNITDDGDIAIDDGLSSIRKRILRRITTSVSEFYHLPDYGTDLESKSNVTPDLAGRIRDRVTNGVRSEPDVLRAATRVYSVRNEPGIIVITVTATTRFGETITVSDRVRVSG